MNDQLRLTPGQIIDAYRKTGLTPTTGVFFARRNARWCGCPMGAIYVAEHHVRLPSDEGLYDDMGDWCDEEYGGDYAHAFESAFDHRGHECEWTQDRSIQGYHDGLVVRAAVEKEWPEAFA